MSFVRVASVILIATTSFVGCSREPASRDDKQPASDSSVVPSGDSVRIVNRVWKVASSTGGAPGQLYTFLSDGTLLIASATGTPLLGTWSYAPGVLTLVEEGIAYKTEILQSTDDELKVRSFNPGGSIDINFVRAKR